MSEADEKVNALKDLPWEDIYNQDNMRVATVGTAETRSNWYMYQWVCKHIPEGKIVDVGCLDGSLIYAIKRLKGSRDIIGVDIAPASLKLAKQNHPDIQFVQADVTNLPFKNDSFDGVLCTQVIEHLVEPKKALNELYRILKVGGTLIVTTPIEKRLIDSLHLAEYDLYKVMDMFEEIDVNFKISYLHKFYENSLFKDKNVFGVSLIKTGEKNGRPRRK